MTVEKCIEEIEHNKKTINQFNLGNDLILDYLVTEDDKREIKKGKENNSDLVDFSVSETSKDKITHILFMIIGFIGAPLMTIINFVVYDKHDFIVLAGGLGLGLITSYFYFKNGIIFKMDQLGIYKSGKLIQWKQINFIHLKTIRSKYATEHYLVIDINSGRRKKIDVSYSDVDLRTIGKVVYSFMARFKTN